MGEPLFDSLFDRFPLGMVLVERGGVIRRANEAFAGMLGYTSAELVGRTVASITHPEELPLDRLAFEKVRGSGQAMTRSKRYLRKDGSTLWGELAGVSLELNGEFIGLAMVQDATARREMEQELLRSKERFEYVARATNDLVYEWDIRSGTIVWNEVLRTHYGFSQPEAASTLDFWDRMIHPDDRARVVADLERAVVSNDELWSSEYRFRKADGSYAAVLDRGLFVRDRDGRALRMIGVMVDSSELRAMQAQLRTAERLASIGTLAAGVAHEINNPLAWALNNLAVAADALHKLGPQLAASESHLVGRANEALVDAQEGAWRVAGIVRDLKTFARPDDEQLAAVDLARVLDATLALAQNEIRHRARVVREFQQVPRVEGNEARLGQVFLNLLINAAQALPDGAADRNEIRVGLRPAPDGRVEVFVSDTGPGIPPEARSRIFDPFFTTKPPGVGTGLGLTICHGIVTAHGGEIALDSNAVRGTTFRVRLPAANGGEPAPPSGGAAEAGPALSGRVLVLDDEPLIGRALKRALFRHQVEVASSPREVLERVRGGASWDLILCDVMMPEMSGVDFFEALRGVAPGLCPRVVFMTGGAFTPRASTFFDTVTNPRLEKPFDAAAVERLLLERRQG